MIWMRQLRITLISDKVKKVMTFGDTWYSNRSHEDLDVEIEGAKYLSTLKDSFIVKIKNLTYNEICEIVDNEYYGVEISAGYYKGNFSTIFSGSVIFVSNDKDNNKDSTTYIICGNNIVAKYGQSRMNLSLNSGINMYSALAYICRRAGISNSKIDTDLKAKILNNSKSTNETFGNYLTNICDNNGLVATADSSYGSDISIINPYRTNNREIQLNKNFVLVNGFPKLTSEGLTLSLLPTFNFMPGDVIMIDNSLINMAVTSDSNISRQINTYMYIDRDGKYVVYQIDYSLSNKDGSFYITLLCKARSYYTKISGGTSDE